MAPLSANNDLRSNLNSIHDPKAADSFPLYKIFYTIRRQYDYAGLMII